VKWGAEPWYGVDFDGTLIKSGQVAPGLWESVWPMVERVRGWLAEGRAVHVVTARAHPTFPDSDLWVNDVVQFCVCHFGAALPVRCDKDGGMVELWDDRAVRVVANEGVDELGAAYDEIFWTVPEKMSLVDKIKTMHAMEAEALVDGAKAKKERDELKEEVEKLKIGIRSRDQMSEMYRADAREFYEDVCRAVGYDPEITSRPPSHVVGLAAEDHAEVKRLREQLAVSNRRYGEIIEARLKDLNMWEADRAALVTARDAFKRERDEHADTIELMREEACPRCR